jgi:hypothetical protein
LGVVGPANSISDQFYQLKLTTITFFLQFYSPIADITLLAIIWQLPGYYVHFYNNTTSLFVLSLTIKKLTFCTQFELF